MSQHTNALWCEKYRPQDITEYVFHDEAHRASILKMIERKNIPHLLLSGVQGSGKTTLARILIKSMELDSTDVLTINASDERGIDVFRQTIKNFATSLAMGRFKIIHLEEADQLTPTAQAALKQFMEEVSEFVRFILTCNHVNKIIAPLRSRCQEFEFRTSDRNDVAEYLVRVLSSEKVRFNLVTLDQYIALGHPDIRKLVNMIQQNTIDGKLLPPPSTHQGGADYKFALLDCLEHDNWSKARSLLSSSIQSNEWEDVYRFLYEHLDESPKFQNTDKWEEGIMILADHLYKHAICADSEINMAACLIRLSQI